MKTLLSHIAAVLCFAIPSVFIPLFSGCTSDQLPEEALSVDEIAIRVDGRSREIGYTNTQAGFFYTESGADHRTGWQGWHIMSQKVLDDYRITLDGVPLERASTRLTEVSPHQFTRFYRNGVKETVTFLDSLDAIVVELNGMRASTICVSPHLDRSQSATDYIIDSFDGMLGWKLKQEPSQNDRQIAPAWVGLSASSGETDTSTDRIGRLFIPGSIVLRRPPASVVIVFAASQTKERLHEDLQFIRTNAASLIARRKERMQRVLDGAMFRSSNQRFERAFAWAVLSMDALVMNQVRKGIFAGLPWFSNYWGRDSFISLPGATLVTGRFEEAKEILRSFAGWQEQEMSNPNAGRIPNLVTPGSIAYNTADGTPWFASALNEYVSCSGDTSFGREMYPVVKRSVEGTLLHHVDAHGFLVHGDAESWMDAVGPDGPWSPRGNRACDVQALWIKQLLSASALARLSGDDSNADRWDSIVDTVFASFQRYFIDDKTQLVFDHLNADGTPDHQLRPNQLFTLDVIQGKEIRTTVFKTVTEQLVYPFGVGSLAATDDNFHPYHHFEPAYVQDAAYHQGIVWTWLNGPWITAAVQFGKSDLAFTVTDNMVHQILDRGAVGTLSELLDAAPRPGELEPRLSGTFSQAWSLAEFLRTTYRSYCGISFDARERHVSISPRLPSALPHVRCTIPLGKERIRVELRAQHEGGIVRLNTEECLGPVQFALDLPVNSTQTRSCFFELQPGHDVTVTLTADGYELIGTGGDPALAETIIQDLPSYPQLSQVRLATPRVPNSLRALRPPDHRLLVLGDVRSFDPRESIVYDVPDSERDDVGTGAFEYPKSQSFVKGCLDLTQVTIATDEANLTVRLRYRALADPGWHPEYGYQLTYTAIAIDVDGQPDSGRREIGRNSQYILSADRSAEYIVFVGGGLRLENAAGKVLAEYRPMPGDEVNPIGNAAERMVSFSLPRSLFSGDPQKWRFTVLVGAQDDHGGAGLGDFRTVERTATEWTGGGKLRATEPNVYDILEFGGVKAR
jgi:glycogen debranching enzyme